MNKSSGTPLTVPQENSIIFHTVEIKSEAEPAAPSLMVVVGGLEIRSRESKSYLQLPHSLAGLYFFLLCLRL